MPDCTGLIRRCAVCDPQAQKTDDETKTKKILTLKAGHETGAVLHGQQLHRRTAF